MQSALDLDDTGSWTPAIRTFAERWATALDGSTHFTCDLALPGSAEESFEKLIGEQPIRAYHCTRLLAEETAAIRSSGLLPLSEDFLIRRVCTAHASGHLTAAERDALLSGSVFASGNTVGRPGQVCTVVGRTKFDDDPGGVDLLLRLWGGEAIYWATHERTALAERLSAIGKPSIVVANLRFAAHSRTPLCFPPLARLFVGRLLKLPGIHGDVHYFGPVGQEDIVDIWQPGHHEYDRNHGIPRC